MLFITNRKFTNENTKPGDKVVFDLKNNEPSVFVTFCNRKSKDDYLEINVSDFFESLRKSEHKQILLYIHGFNNLPEQDIFPRAEYLQLHLDRIRPYEVEVVPMIWPCDNDIGIIKDYWDDQKSAEASGPAFARVLGKFLEWRDKFDPQNPCLKRINLLAHSMGNRVLRYTLASWAKDYGSVPALFRNIFMVAADIANESLERGEEGEVIPPTSRNVVVYFASDDLALRTSKIANLKNKVITRRLGHTGPEHLDRVSKNVYAIDCDDFNDDYDKPLGHAYFLGMNQCKEEPGSVFKHMLHSMLTGRVDCGLDPKAKTLVLSSNYEPPQ